MSSSTVVLCALIATYVSSAAANTVDAKPCWVWTSSLVPEHFRGRIISYTPDKVVLHYCKKSFGDGKHCGDLLRDSHSCFAVVSHNVNVPVQLTEGGGTDLQYISMRNETKCQCGMGNRKRRDVVTQLPSIHHYSAQEEVVIGDKSEAKYDEYNKMSGIWEQLFGLRLIKTKGTLGQKKELNPKLFNNK